MSFDEPGDGLTVIAKSEMFCKVKIVARKGAVLPSRYTFSFERQGIPKAMAGEFNGDVKHDRDNVYSCEMKVKAPPGPGNYQLRAAPLPIKSLHMTAEEKISTSIRIKVVN